MRKPFFLLLATLALYVLLIFPFAAYMKQKPFVEKIGYAPKADILRLAVADQKEIVTASLIMRVLIYFGGVVEMLQKQIKIPTDYRGMYEMIDTALKLDPYNMDGYYFAQATLVWDVRKIDLANELLEHGMKYRTWDWYLPFFAGFNYAYFLKDYEKASYYYKKTAELTGNELSIQLTGRYLYEAGKTDHAIMYLSMMEKGAKNEAVKKNLQIRLKAFKEVKKIEDAIAAYKTAKGTMPSSLEELTAKGYLKEKAVDPYGGKFYIDEGGHVRATSKFAFGAVDNKK
jgi:tetratricopeptide (TPR) repeat protein